ncbi:MAG: S8 family peptidase, partial [Candidatus Hodarchaeales archaeon]
MKIDFFKKMKLIGLFFIILLFIPFSAQLPSSFPDFIAGKVVRRLSHDEEIDLVDVIPPFPTDVDSRSPLDPLNTSDEALPLTAFRSKSSKQRFLDSLNQSSPFTADHSGQPLFRLPVSTWTNDFSRFIISFDSMQSMRDCNLGENVKKLANFPICFMTPSDHSFEVIMNDPSVTGVYTDSTNKIINDTWTGQTTGDPLTQYESFLATVKLDTLHSMGLTGAGVKIAILDTGIDTTHPDLDDFDGDSSTNDPKILLEASFVDFDDDGIADTSPTDKLGHGTHVAGIAAANGILKGAAPGAWLLNGKVIDNNGYGRPSWIMNGIDWAITNGADIISLSLSIDDLTLFPVLETVIQNAWENNVLVVVSAGNSGPYPNSVSDLGLATRALTVGASGILNSVAAFSSRGPSISGEIKPNVVAPGESILSTVPYGYGEMSGTSMSAPIVSGLAAVLMSADSSLGVDLIRSAIISTATQLDYHIFS